MSAPTSTTTSPRLRVGVLLDSDELPAWAFEVLAQIHRSDFAEIALLIDNASAAPAAQQPLLARLRGIRTENLVYNAVCRLDRLIHRGRTTAFQPRMLSELQLRCPRLPVQPIRGKFTDEFPTEDLEAIHAHRLDVLLRFGFRILKGGVLRAAGHGVWSYHHGDNRRYRGGPAGFWEVMRGDPSTGCVLQELSEELDNGRILGRLTARTLPTSAHRNQDRLFWRSSSMMLRKLEELARTGNVASEPAPRGAEEFFDQRLYTVPRNAEMARLCLGMVARGAVHLSARVSHAVDWQVAYRLDEQGPWTSFHRYRTLTNPEGAFWADPFPVQRDGRFYLLLEEFVYANRQGRIAVVEVDRRGQRGEARLALERPYHLSYPSLFEWRGETYMLVEASRNRTIEAYRCQRFPDRWELAAVLLDDIDAGDPTLYRQGDDWFLFFAGRLRPGEDYDDLHLLTARNPLGRWRPNSANPVKSDVRSSRPAGGLFQMDGKLYRPAQDGARHYGHAITINEVTELRAGDPPRFEERAALTIRPEWRTDLAGTHTFQRGPGITAIDVLVRVPRLSAGQLQRTFQRVEALVAGGRPGARLSQDPQS